MTERKKHEDDPEAWLKDYPATFDPAYRDDIAENKEGRLSARQLDLIRTWDYQIPPVEGAQILRTLEQEKPARPSPVLIWLVGGLGLGIAALLLSPNATTLSYVCGLWLLIVVFWPPSRSMPETLAPQEISARYRAEETARRKRLRTDDSARKVIRIEGTPTYDRLYAVTMNDSTYSVEPPLYRWLREHSSRVAVYAIEGWYPPHALSVEPLDVPIPLTPEERLQTVVGVSSEGELVYADDPQHEDARPIENTRSGSD